MERCRRHWLRRPNYWTVAGTVALVLGALSGAVEGKRIAEGEFGKDRLDETGQIEPLGEAAFIDGVPIGLTVVGLTAGSIFLSFRSGSKERRQQNQHGDSQEP